MSLNVSFNAHSSDGKTFLCFENMKKEVAISVHFKHCSIQMIIVTITFLHS